MEDIVFIGDWIKDRLLGSGSFGTVVLWRHKSNDQKLAIKTCKWGDELTAKHRERWSKEVEMLQNCNHPNIVGTKELPPEFKTGLAQANPSKLPILCMEYCSGGDLRQLLNKPDSCGGLKEVQVRKILNDLGSAMRFLHSNKITHRDLKPENIVMCVSDPNSEQSKVTYKIIDLGYAKEIDSNSICASFVGTLQYLAPELFYSKTYSNSVDFWSFGLIAFEIICGTRPFLPNKAPVEWMPVVKKKSHDHICVYETFHNDVSYSKEIFPENHISKPLKALLEEWLKVALEYDPKLRGRDAPSKVTFAIPSEEKGNNVSNVIIFSLLEKVLSKKIIKVFSVTTLSHIAYEIDDATTILTLKSWINKDTNITTDDQILISQMTYIEIGNEELVAKYWNETSVVMLFVYNKKQMIDDNSAPIVPKAVQRCLELHKALYNFKNSQNLYRNSFYFVISQMDIYDALINGIYTRAESLKQESKQLLVKHNTTDKNLGKLLAKVEIVTKMTDLGKHHIKSLKENGVGTNFLGGFGKTFKNADEIVEKTQKLQTAWSQLSVRLQSAARRSNEGISNELNNFVAKYNYQSMFTNAYKIFTSHKKSDFYNENREKERQCPEIVKLCYDCLKLRSKILQELQHQQFVLKLKDLSTEFSKITDIISKATENSDRLNNDLSALIDEFNNCIWSTMSVVVRDADNVADLPYSVVSFQKRDFKIGESVSNHCIPVANTVRDDSIKSLISESLTLRQNHTNLCDKLDSQKKFLQQSIFDFSFLSDA
ncbi:inhibitor of nuclear factor kappa-B kinase subunit alpha [Maniola hyperantus]|uniref:inhibitor of nuclear factor kappa-B kinase subunit alpha n=1 Tax=Aphantopus hyperantus TaxID=2795564 RepID=UPI00156A1D3B|nr:inhibitor of nuclear factor kappa-B kinase subunit alpha [Maniola hyperantus]